MLRTPLTEAGGCDLSLMARLLPEMPGRFLWLATPENNGRKARADEKSVAAGARVMKAFTTAALEILGLRRAGEVVALELEGALAAKYLRGMDRYRGWVGLVGERHGIDPGPVLRELPGALCFGLGFLCRHSGSGEATAPPMVALMADAFRMARRLVRRHCRELALFLNADRVERGVELARRMVGNLEEKGPLSQRQLVRCFKEQRKERFEPVIDVLLRLGAMVMQEDGKLAAGDADLADVEDRMREALLTPRLTAPGVGQSAKTKPPGTTRARKQAGKPAASETQPPAKRSPKKGPASG